MFFALSLIHVNKILLYYFIIGDVRDYKRYLKMLFNSEQIIVNKISQPTSVCMQNIKFPDNRKFNEFQKLFSFFI